MKINEMEPLIDKLGFDKLEVKMYRNGDVHWFICGKEIVPSMDGETKLGNIIVYNGEGQAFITDITDSPHWNVGESFTVIVKGYGLALRTEKDCYRMKRFVSLDLDRIG